MVVLTEFRIPMHSTVEEYQVAQLYSVAKMSEAETSGDEGVEILKNEPYEKDGEHGQYTYKIYHLGSKMPGWMAALLPKDLKQVHEEAWNAYPTCKTVITSPYFQQKFLLMIESKHLPFNGTFEDNVHNLSVEQLKMRTIETIDIAFDEIDPKECPEDPKVFKSQKSGRGPLDQKGWEAAVKPAMCCYKLVTVRADMALVGAKAAAFIMKYERKLFFKMHRQLFCWTDEWYGQTMEDIRRLEAETKEKTRAKLEAAKAAQAAGKK
eukprot:TRINITY_DN1295_c0_g1_i1.p2 TRINITY_DN1295_c0_g1~~TRINITY_DN1295_c0_g1_i1.p2  ORF type:complete len:265 (+),score=55.45 TRINITY_DN1295_c0_g1_i1:50-844(+)